MKNFKKLIALMLIFLLSFSLSACGGKNNKGNETSATVTEEPAATEEPTEEATPEPTQEAVDPYPAFDMGGRTIKIAQWWDRYYDSGDTKVEDNPNVTNVETAQMQLDNLRRIEAKYNCKIEFVNLSWSGMIESINTSIAAGTPDMDIYTVDLQFGIPALANGLAMPVKDYAPATSDVMTGQSFIQTMDTFGETYLFHEKGVDGGGLIMGYNADLINSLGLEDPQALYEKGEWTWDKFAEYAKAATKDTDGDSTPDQYGWAGVYGTTLGFVYANNGVIAPGETEQLSSTNVVEAYDFINKLYNVDKSAKYFNNTEDTFTENLYAWANGNVLFWGGQAWMFKAGATNYGADFEYHVVPFPKGPHGDGTIYTPKGGNWYMLPKGTKNPDQVYQVFEEYCNWFNGDTSYINDTTDLETYFLDTRDMEIALDVANKSTLDLAEKVGFNLGEFSNSIVTGEKTVAQAVETYKPLLQDSLNNVFKK